MLNTPVAHPLSQAIYEGILEEPPWKTLLKDLEEYMQVPSATLVLRRPRFSDPGLTIYLYSDSHSDALSDFQSKAHLDSPFAELPENKVFTLNDRVTSSELKPLIFNEYLNTYNVSDLMGFDVYDKQSHIRLRLRIIRIGNAPAFSPQDRARLESILPLMNKALKMYGAYSNSNFREGVYDELLGSMDIASVVMNTKLELLSANSQAMQILAAKDGVFLRHKILHCCLNSDQRKLEKICHTLSHEAGPDTDLVQRPKLSIHRNDRDSKWDAHVRRVSSKNFVFDEDGPKLVLVLQDPACDFTPSQSSLIEAFGVTPAEARLIALLVNGLTLTAAAESLGVSRNTARAQLSSVFAKTGVNRQTQLIKLVADAFSARWR